MTRCSTATRRSATSADRRVRIIKLLTLIGATLVLGALVGWVVLALVGALVAASGLLRVTRRLHR